MEASKVTVGKKTYDMNYLTGKKKTALRRKLIVEFIQSKPAGELIRTPQFQVVGRFSSQANTHAFVKRMIRDGVISQYEADRPNTYYYAVLGAVRTQTSQSTVEASTRGGEYDFTVAINNLKQAGLRFTITISNEGK